jgi:hypothetical protein
MTFCTQQKVSSLNNKINRKMCASYIESKRNEKLAIVSLINARQAEGFGTANLKNQPTFSWCTFIYLISF